MEIRLRRIDEIGRDHVDRRAFLRARTACRRAPRRAAPTTASTAIAAPMSDPPPQRARRAAARRARRGAFPLRVHQRGGGATRFHRSRTLSSPPGGRRRTSRGRLSGEIDRRRRRPGASPIERPTATSRSPSADRSGSAARSVRRSSTSTRTVSPTRRRARALRGEPLRLAQPQQPAALLAPGAPGRRAARAGVPSSRLYAKKPTRSSSARADPFFEVVDVLVALARKPDDERRAHRDARDAAPELRR